MIGRGGSWWSLEKWHTQCGSAVESWEQSGRQLLVERDGRLVWITLNISPPCLESATGSKINVEYASALVTACKRKAGLKVSLCYGDS